MRHLRLNTDLYRTLVLTILAGLAAVTVAMANRNVYTKEQVDARFESVNAVDTVRHQNLDDDVAEIKGNVWWIVRNMGGDPDATSGPDNHTP